MPPSPPHGSRPPAKDAHLTPAQRRCTPAACAIQACLRRHAYAEAPCAATIRAYHACVARVEAEEGKGEVGEEWGGGEGGGGGGEEEREGGGGWEGKDRGHEGKGGKGGRGEGGA